MEVPVQKPESTDGTVSNSEKLKILYPYHIS